MKIKLIKLNFRILLFTFAFLLLPSLSFAQTKAVWVRPFIGAREEVRADPRAGREFIRRELESIKRAGLNTIYVEAFWDGYAMYPSKVVPIRPLEIPYGVKGKNSGWDVLSVYIEEGKRLDLKIHAWLHVFHQWNSNIGGLEKSPIFSANPDWAALNSAGSPFVKSEAEGAKRDIYKVFMSPSNPEVRKYLRAVVAELVDKYLGLGGVQWDYIRYPLQTPGESFDYNPKTLAQFQKETGINARRLSPKETPREWKIWQDWKTKQVNETVEELAGVVRNKRPAWEISAAVFAGLEENLRVKQQDWKTWAERGWVDALLPMLYSTDYTRVEMWAKEFRREVVAPKTKIYPAVFIGHFYNVKENKFDARYLQLTEKYRFDGFGLFAAQSLTDDLIDKLAKRN